MNAYLTLQIVGKRTASPLFLLPFDQDSQFVGREDILFKLDELLKTKKRLALTGIGGVG